ncbi:glutathione peroxidase [Stylonychia lemnae]|uniref:Glutathione peroxidase n=1 Tax=Stylonychia lemnae TaxID=5949 RepID=A0A078AIV0_STYLE|nr:glutathione peroxidase [Stylonychia lemnae]|eukprot:CDW82235.1 glutathione peroxidase [Stylonychia lemnae]
MATSFDSLFEIGAVDIDGQVINKLGDLLYGKKCILVTNTASLSPHANMNFRSLQELYEKYESKGLEILAFPCNQFHKQEPLNDNEIKVNAQEKYDVTFPMFSKAKVNGVEESEVFKFLKSKSSWLVEHIHNKDNDQAHFKIKDIPGNFTKFLVDRNGRVTDCLIGEGEDPIKLEQRIRKLLDISGMV